MIQDSQSRGKFWWLWPYFLDEKDAHDGAKMGVIACSLIAVVTGLTFFYQYYIDGEFDQLLGGILFAIIYSVLGYGIFKMSRVACSTAIILFIAEKFYSSVIQGKSLGIAILLAWYLFQANRAIYWFRGEWTRRKVAPPRRGLVE